MKGLLSSSFIFATYKQESDVVYNRGNLCTVLPIQLVYEEHWGIQRALQSDITYAIPPSLQLLTTNWRYLLGRAAAGVYFWEPKDFPF